MITPRLTNSDNRSGIGEFSHRVSPQGLTGPGDLRDGEHGHHVAGAGPGPGVRHHQQPPDNRVHKVF